MDHDAADSHGGPDADGPGAVAIVGTCPPERAGYARHFASRTGRTLHTAARVSLSADPVDEAIALAPWSGDQGSVIEFPPTVSPTEIIGRFAHPDSPARLTGMICVVDTAHLIDDILREDYIVRHLGHGRVHRARALATVTQIEYASSIVLTGWDALSTPDLSQMMAVVSALAPRARLRLHPAPVLAPETAVAQPAAQDRPGWICVLNDEHEPHMTDPHVSSMRYQSPRLFHPGRLRRLLDEGIENGDFGTVLRSVGFCRLATRPGTTAHWEHVGTMFSLPPVGTDEELGQDGEMLAIGQDIAFIGLDLDHPALSRALDEATLSDDEFAAGPEAWSRFADPFPAWISAEA